MVAGHCVDNGCRNNDSESVRSSWPLPHMQGTEKMDAANTAADRLGLLRAHELALGRLYRTYANTFPQHRDLWTRLSQEEQEHADWIDALRLKVEEESSGLVVDRFPAAAIEHSIDYVNRLIDRAHRSDLTAVNAMANALDLENAMIESRYFEVFASDSVEIKRTLSDLARSTQAHHEQVRRALQTARQTP